MSVPKDPREGVREPSSTDSAEPTADELAYDEYSDHLLAGDAPEPEEFLRGRHGVSQGVRELLRRMYDKSSSSGAADELPFERLGEYRLLERLGRGGMGLVFLAEQESLGRRVALKVLRPELQGSSVARERFRRETRAVAGLRHDNIVTVHGGGEEHGVCYLAMELVEGRTLAEMIRGGEALEVPLARRVRWIASLARALDYAHAQGIVHRDVKPSNVRITADDRALLLDFGLVRSADEAGATLTDSFAGSPSYASPEQISTAHQVDGRTDVYSLAVTLYQCLTGVVPFDGDSVEQLFHRILTAAPTPPRVLDPGLPRDLETVTLKGMERDPERRYATAGELADDLEAVLELRPIRGRPPSVVERTRRAARRHPVGATAIVAGVLVVLALVAGSLLAARGRRLEKQAEARQAVETARDRVHTYRESRSAVGALTGQVEKLRKDQTFSLLTDEEFALLDENEARLARLQRSWEVTYYDVLDLLRHAERLDPRVAGLAAVRAELYHEKYLEASDAGEEGSAEFFRDLVFETDPGGEFAEQLATRTRLSVESSPPGAEVFLFRFEEQSALFEGGQSRMVPVPVSLDGAAAERVSPPRRPGTWCLLAGQDAGPLRRGDLLAELAGHPIEGTVLVLEGRAPVAFGDRLVEVDGEPFEDRWAIDFLGRAARPGVGGAVPRRRFVFERDGATFEVEGESLEELGVRAATPAAFAASNERPAVPALRLRDGLLESVDLPPGLDLRTTAAPLFSAPACSLGPTPIVDQGLPFDHYVVLLRKPGYLDLVVAVRADRERRIAIDLVPEERAPPGFVRVPGYDPAGSRDFWLMEREVTAGEYLEFLNLPRTLAGIDDAPDPIRYPRQFSGTNLGPLWPRGSEGESDERGPFRLPPGWTEDWPVLGISWHDAVAYAAWRTEEARAAGLDWRYALPDSGHFMLANGHVPWLYPYGARFRANWARTCFSRPIPSPGPVMEFPIDRTITGVYDLSGSAMEWLDDWFDRNRDQRFLGGSAWGQSSDETARVPGGFGAPAEMTTGETGFRLVLYEETGEERR